jgi:chromosome segregation ATPase
MSLLSNRLSDLEKERDYLSQSLLESSRVSDEQKKQIGLFINQIENKNKEILLLRGQIKMLSQNKTGQEVEINTLRRQIEEISSENINLKKQVFFYLLYVLF